MSGFSRKNTNKPSVLARIGSYNPNYLTKVFATKTDLASKDLFLNRMTKNGWRENIRGKFNLAYNAHRTNTPTYYHQPNNLAKVSKIFGDPRIHIKVEDYLKIEPRLISGDFVYLDPPYEPASKTANFTSYTCNYFGQQEQRQLADFVNRIDAKGVRFILSNSLAARGLYTNPKFNITIIQVKSYKNGKPPRFEILVNN